MRRREKASRGNDLKATKHGGGVCLPAQRGNLVEIVSSEEGLKWDDTGLC